MFLLDTNVVSEPVRPRPNAHVLQRFEEHSETLAIASVVWHELWFGAERLQPGKRRRYIEKYLVDVVADAFAFLPYDRHAARWHARERARLASNGEPPPFVDGQIAAIAATQNLILVTRNTADFERFQGLTTENWFEK